MTLHWRDLNTADRIDAVTTLRDAGKNKSEIAAELDVTVDSLHGFAFRQNIDGVVNNKTRTGGWYDLTTEEKIARIRQLTKDGLSLAEVADAIGLTLPAIYAFRHNHGLLDLSNRRVSIAVSRPPMETDDREIDPDAWKPLGPPVGFVENSACRWPVDGGWCGHAIHRKHFCQHHYAKAYPSKVRLSDDSIEWLAKTDDRARPRKDAPVARAQGKREAVRYDDE